VSLVRFSEELRYSHPAPTPPPQLRNPAGKPLPESPLADPSTSGTSFGHSGSHAETVISRP